jgi:hypothetical protein
VSSNNFNFRRGAEQAEQAVKDAAYSGGKVRFFGLADGDSVIVRLVTEYMEWISVAQHNGVPTIAAPADFKGSWPTSMTAVCQNDKAFADDNGNYFPGYGQCVLCKSDAINSYGKPVSRTAIRHWALACVREPVLENGVRVGCTDKVVELGGDDDSKKTKGRDVIVVNMGWKNFFSSLNGFKFAYGSAADRDYMIRRTGEGRDTSYQFMPLDPIPGYKPGGAEWPYDKECETQDLDLGTIVSERASAEYYAKFFGDGTKSASAPSGEQPSSAPVADAAADVPDQAALAAMKARVQDRIGQASGS